MATSDVVYWGKHANAHVYSWKVRLMNLVIRKDLRDQTTLDEIVANLGYEIEHQRRTSKDSTT